MEACKMEFFVAYNTTNIVISYTPSLFIYQQIVFSNSYFPNQKLKYF